MSHDSVVAKLEYINGKHVCQNSMMYPDELKLPNKSEESILVIKRRENGLYMNVY
jgi:hypothetical protein